MGMGGPATSRFNGNLHLHFCARHDREDRRNSLSDFRFFGTAALDFLCECHYEFGPGADRVSQSPHEDVFPA